MTTPLFLPVIVRGTRLESSRETQTFNYSGREVTLPCFDDSTVSSMLETSGSLLTDISIDDIVLFFDQVGARWRDAGNEWRRLAIEWSSATTGYATSTVEWDINFIGGILQRQKLYDLIDSEIGDAGLLDEFTRHKAVNRRCFPLGKLLNILVGNVPIASFISIIRSLATKNETICKLPSRDVVTGLCFANCIYETDPGHPVTKALSCGYWASDSPVNQALLDGADGVVVWGKGETIAQIRRSTPSETPIIEYGPKRSLSIVDLREAKVDRYEAFARRIAYDVCSYDQEACFSVQQLFCIGGAKAAGDFVVELERAFADFAVSLPGRLATLDERYHVVRARSEAAARGESLHSAASDWKIIETVEARQIFDHPLARTLYVHSVNSIDEVLTRIDRSVQTVSYEPYEAVAELAAKIGAAGAARIVRSGRHGRFRPGVSQDGTYGMNRLVRWVSWERDLDYKYRFMSASASDDEQRIYYQLATKAE